MKKICHVAISTLLFLSLTSLSCEKKTVANAAQSNAVITGFDQRTCVCCGGLMINFNGETKSYTGQFYLVDNDLSGLGIPSNSTFPILVTVEWKALDKCSGQYIEITKLARR